MFSEHDERMSSERPLTSSYHDMVDILREQFQVAQEREHDYREHIARLTTMLDQAHQQTNVSLRHRARRLSLRQRQGRPPRLRRHVAKCVGSLWVLREGTCGQQQ
jgi:hypothetical protein